MPNTSAMTKTNQLTPLTLVLGGTGKTGRRIVERLTARGWPSALARATWPRLSIGLTSRGGKRLCME